MDNTPKTTPPNAPKTPNQWAKKATNPAQAAGTGAQKTPQKSPASPKTTGGLISKITGNATSGATITPGRKVTVAPTKEKIVTKQTNFLKGAEKKQDKKEALYSNFFQKGKDGKITVGQQEKKTMLEIFVQILSFFGPIFALIVIGLFVHVFIRGQENSEFAENFPIICGYLHSGVEWSQDEDFGCNTISEIKTQYQEKNTTQNKNIIQALSEYLPVKISTNQANTSPEKKFIEETYAQKSDLNAIMQRFKEATEYAQNANGKNIICTGINIKDGDTLSTQCSVYGMKMGQTNPVRSARLEALNFTEFIADTNRSNFILTNPPTSLAIEENESNDPEEEWYGYATRTSLPISIKYVPFTSKN